MSGPKEKRKKKSQISSGLLGRQKTDLLINQRSGSRNRTPICFLQAVFLVEHRNSPPRNLGTGLKRGTAFLFDLLSHPPLRAELFRLIFTPCYSPPQACNPWVTSVSLRDKPRNRISFFRSNPLLFCRCEEVAQYLKLRRIFGTHSAPFIFRENWFVATLPMPERASSPALELWLLLAGRAAENPRRQHTAG